MGEEYKVKITTEGQPAGANAVIEALNKTGEATAGVGKESRATASIVDELGRRGSNAKDVYEGLRQTMHGGEGAIFGVAKAWRNLSAAFAANPLGAVLAVSLALGPALFAVAQKFLGVGDAAKKAGDASADAAPKVDKLAEAFKKAGDAKSAAFTQELIAIRDAAKGAADELDRVMKLREQLDKAKSGLDKDTIANDPNLTDEQKKQKLFEREQRDADEARRREEVRRGEEFFGAKQTAEDTAGVRNRIETDRDEFQKGIDAAKERERQRLERIGQLERGRAADDSRPNEGTTEERAARGRRRIAIEDELRSLKKPEGLAEQAKLVAEQLRRVEQLNKDLEKAAADAKAAAEAFAQISKQVDGIRPDGSAVLTPTEGIIHGIENKARRKRFGVPEPAPRGGASGSVQESPRVNIGGREFSGSELDGATQKVTGGGEASGAAVDRLVKAVEGVIIINGKIVQQFDSATQRIEIKQRELENQIKGLRR